MDNLAFVIEQLRACRAELERDNVLAEQIAAARVELAEREAKLAAYPAQPSAYDRDGVLRLAHWMRGHDALAADVRAARDYLHELQHQFRAQPDDLPGYETPRFDDETHSSVRRETWQQRTSRETGIPLQGDRF